MDNLWEYRSWLDDDSSVTIIHVNANDPRFNVTQSAVVVCATDDLSLADLEVLTADLRDECGWGLGHIEEFIKRGGGIGASGLETLGLVLGVVGDVPTILMILDKLKRKQPPVCADREEAWDKATLAVALQYATVQRTSLYLKSETRYSDHWQFEMGLEQSSDAFVVDVYGARAHLVATMIKWINGDPSGRQPGADSS